jgi:hypothetical protein
MAALYTSFNVRRRYRTCRCTPGSSRSRPNGDAVTTCTSHPSRARYLDNPAQRCPPTVPSGGKWYVTTRRRCTAESRFTLTVYPLSGSGGERRCAKSPQKQTRHGCTLNRRDCSLGEGVALASAHASGEHIAPTSLSGMLAAEDQE